MRGVRMVSAIVIAVAGLLARGTVSADTFRVVVTLPPLAGVVEAIGGDRVTVQSLLGPGDNPHTYDPTPRQVETASGADLFVGAGATFETQLMARLAAARPGFPAVNVAAAGAGMAQTYHSHDGHDELDPHVWLSGPTLKKVARIIAAAMAQHNPENGAAYQSNLDKFLERAAQVDDRIGYQLAPYDGRPFLVYHPAFGYFAEVYGLRQLAIEHDGHDPSPRRLQQTIEEAREAGIKVIFVQPQFNPHAVEAVRQAIGGETAVLDPLKRDVLQNLRDIADALEKSFKK